MPKSNDAFRQAVAMRDGWYCYYCGVPLVKSADPQAINAPQLEHRIPQCQGGTYALENLVLACRHCNGFKRHSTEQNFLVQLAYSWHYYEWLTPKQKRLIPPYWLDGGQLPDWMSIAIVRSTL